MAQEQTPAHPATMEAQIAISNVSEDAPIPQPILTTDRLIVRPLHPKNAADMAFHGDSPAITKYMYLSFPSPYTLDDANHWIELNMGQQHQTNFGIAEASSPDILIGGIGLKLGSDVSSHTAEVGFWVGEKYWGKGYTTEVLKGFTKWSFESFEGKDQRKLTRLVGRVFSGNTASMRCLEKCGYVHEGVLKAHVQKNGEIRDMHLFGLLKSDWEAKR
jgi:ribosomal-protein-alanine N-acetyltransferase